MTEDFWQKKWQKNDIGFNQEKPNPLLIRYFSDLKLRTEARIFVPLCGKSIDMLWLIEQGFSVIGVELSAIACEAFFKENNIPYSLEEQGAFMSYQSDKITLLVGDFFKLTLSLLGKVDAVFDRAALIALPASIRPLYANTFANLLEPKTTILLVTLSYDQNEMAGPPFSVDSQEIEFLYGKDFQVIALHNQPAGTLPARLTNKGLCHAIDQVHQLIHR